jgi:hypothetical protein
MAILTALTQFLQQAYQIFGPVGTWALIILLFAAAAAWMLWAEHRKQSELRRLLSGYELYMASLIEQVRASRIETLIARGTSAGEAARTVDKMYPKKAAIGIPKERGLFSRVLAPAQASKSGGEP